MPFCPSSPVPPVLKHLGALYAEFGADLLECLHRLPAPFTVRATLPLGGRLLALCAAAVVGGQDHPTAIADWAATASPATLEVLGLRSRSANGRHRRPDAATISRALTGLATEALEVSDGLALAELVRCDWW